MILIILVICFGAESDEGEECRPSVIARTASAAKQDEAISSRNKNDRT